jgi:hypothetical protein
MCVCACKTTRRKLKQKTMERLPWAIFFLDLISKAHATKANMEK